MALPDPGFAGSALGAMGYLALSDEYGMDYYERLKANGAVQVGAIGDVVTGVAEGRFKAGIALDNTVRAAVDKGSPIRMVWPTPGAIAMYSPIAIFAVTPDAETPQSFVDHVLTLEGQQAIADTGWQPIRSDVPWPDYGPQVARIGRWSSSARMSFSRSIERSSVADARRAREVSANDRHTTRRKE